MGRAVEALAVRPQHVLIDARRIPGCDLPQEPIVGGDALCHAIAAASILAKTTRDALMRDYEQVYPGYGFAEHKGYTTTQHREAIRRLGPCPIHRKSFVLLPPPTLWD
jgi:ribonuclease HII